jgi:hypothetical protein
VENVFQKLFKALGKSYKVNRKLQFVIYQFITINEPMYYQNEVIYLKDLQIKKMTLEIRENHDRLTTNLLNTCYTVSLCRVSNSNCFRWQ